MLINLILQIIANLNMQYWGENGIICIRKTSSGLNSNSWANLCR